MNYKVDFNTDLISVIKYTPKQESCYVYVEATQDTKTFFGKIKKGLPKGWKETSHNAKRIYKTEELLKEHNYYYYDKIDNSIYFKPFVEIRLTTGEYISRRFETKNDAEEWIEKLKNKSNKNFETVTYE